MRTRTSLIFVVGAVLGAAVATRRLLSLVGAISGRPLWGYGASLKRPQVAAEILYGAARPRAVRSSPRVAWPPG